MLIGNERGTAANDQANVTTHNTIQHELADDRFCSQGNGKLEKDVKKTVMMYRRERADFKIVLLSHKSQNETKRTRISGVSPYKKFLFAYPCSDIDTQIKGW